MPYYGFNDNGGAGDDFIGYWSKYPVSDEASILDTTYTDPLTSETFNMPRAILECKLNLDNKQDIWIYGCHLKSEYGDDVDNVKKRRAQSKALADHMLANRDLETDHIMIMGDMNTAKNEDFYSNGTIGYLTFIYDNATNDTNDFVPINIKYLPFTEYTYDNPPYQSVLDHIILSPMVHNNNYVSVEIPTVSGSPAPSDHKPVLVKLKY